jgi:DNA (cytosine-5)-methyltransferase 1
MDKGTGGRMVYYNEFDPYAAQWLRNLIDAGHIAKGEVDTRSIKDVSASDLTGYVQCHFFAGLGGWSHALRLAGWPDDRPVWTGSCPCQPFSAAGTQKGTADDRHLWPVWFNLIRECRPGVVFGEQVEAAINHGWLDLVQSDLESESYACGAAGIPAAGVGAPHIRQRLWFVADDINSRRSRIGWRGEARAAERSEVGRLADADSGRHDGWPTATGRQAGASAGIASSSAFDQLADDLDTRLQGRLPGGAHEEQQNQHGHVGRGRAAHFWSDCDWLPCRDGKSRPVESGTFPLVNGATARVGRLRAYGNAIVPQVAQVFIEAYLES